MVFSLREQSKTEIKAEIGNILRVSGIPKQFEGHYYTIKRMRKFFLIERSLK
jgi:hypothetical protein